MSKSFHVTDKETEKMNEVLKLIELADEDVVVYGEGMDEDDLEELFDGLDWREKAVEVSLNQGYESAYFHPKYLEKIQKIFGAKAINSDSDIDAEVEKYYSENEKEIDEAFSHYCFYEGNFEHQDQKKMFNSDRVFWEFVENYMHHNKNNGEIPMDESDEEAVAILNTEMADKVREVIVGIFPESYVGVQSSGPLGSKDVYVHFAFGKNKDEWEYGIIHNDPLHTIFRIEGWDNEYQDDHIEDAKSVKAKLLTGVRGIKFPSNKMSPDSLLKRLGEYFGKLKDHHNGKATSSIDSDLPKLQKIADAFSHLNPEAGQYLASYLYYYAGHDHMVDVEDDAEVYEQYASELPVLRSNNHEELNKLQKEKIQEVADIASTLDEDGAKCLNMMVYNNFEIYDGERSPEFEKFNNKMESVAILISEQDFGDVVCEDCNKEKCECNEASSQKVDRKNSHNDSGYYDAKNSQYIVEHKFNKTLYAVYFPDMDKYIAVKNGGTATTPFLTSSPQKIKMYSSASEADKYKELHYGNGEKVTEYGEPVVVEVTIKCDDKAAAVAKTQATAKLVQKHNKNTDRKEWALVSKSDPSKVLEWYGMQKPSEERVKKSEQRVQYFKHVNAAAKKTIHFWSEKQNHPSNPTMCYTNSTNPVVTENPEEVTCKQCKYNMMLKGIKGGDRGKIGNTRSSAMNNYLITIQVTTDATEEEVEEIASHCYTQLETLGDEYGRKHSPSSYEVKKIGATASAKTKVIAMNDVIKKAELINSKIGCISGDWEKELEMKFSEAADIDFESTYSNGNDSISLIDMYVFLKDKSLKVKLGIAGDTECETDEICGKLISAEYSVDGKEFFPFTHFSEEYTNRKLEEGELLEAGEKALKDQEKLIEKQEKEDKKELDKLKKEYEVKASTVEILWSKKVSDYADEDEIEQQDALLDKKAQDLGGEGVTMFPEEYSILDGNYLVVYKPEDADLEDVAKKLMEE